MTKIQLYQTISLSKYIQVGIMRLIGQIPYFYGRGVVGLASKSEFLGEASDRGGEW